MIEALGRFGAFCALHPSLVLSSPCSIPFSRTFIQLATRTRSALSGHALPASPRQATLATERCLDQGILAGPWRFAVCWYGEEAASQGSKKHAPVPSTDPSPGRRRLQDQKLRRPANRPYTNPTHLSAAIAPLGFPDSITCLNPSPTKQSSRQGHPPGRGRVQRHLLRRSRPACAQPRVSSCQRRVPCEVVQYFSDSCLCRR